jgi:protein phosphatase
MGCTLVVVWLVQEQALIANVGDSRCYHLRGGTLSQITRDHSFVQFQLDNGLISEADARGSERKNYLLRSVGTATKVSADFFAVDLDPGDVLLSVSDGMTEALGHEALQGIVLEAMRSPQPAQALVKAAIDSGSRDNVSVQFIRVGQNNTGSAPKVRESAKGPRGFWRRMLGKRARG